MRGLTLLRCVAFCVAGGMAGCGQTGQTGQTDAPSGPVLYEGARLIVGDDSAAIEDGTLLVENGRISAIGQSGAVTAPAGAARVDLSGKTVMPTLVNGHMHPGYEGSPANNHANLGAENWTPENVLAHMQREAYYGVGVVLSAGADETERAQRFEQDQAAGKFPPAARYVFGAGMDLPAGGPDAVLMKAANTFNALYKATTPDEGRAQIQKIASRNIRHVKVWLDVREGAYSKLTPEINQTYVAIYDEAEKHQVKVHTHSRPLPDQKAAVRGGTDILVHTSPDPMDEEFLALLRERRPYWTPVGGQGAMSVDPTVWCKDPFVNQGVPMRALMATNSVVTGEPGQAGCNPHPPTVKANDVKFAETFRQMLGAGARLVLGTDIGVGRYMYGWAEHFTLARYVAFGLTPSQAIQAATQRTAEMLGLDDTGTLAAGKRADFIVLNANPLDDIRNTRQIDSVYLGGVRLDREGLLASWNKISLSTQ